MTYKVGDKVWVKCKWKVYKGKILAKFDDDRYAVKLFMRKSAVWKGDLAKRGGKK